MNFQSAERIQSKTVPEVWFSIREMTYARRAAVRAALAETQTKLRRLFVESQKLNLELGRLLGENNFDTARFESLKLRLLEAEDESLAIQNDELYPTWIRFGLEQLEGLAIDGKPADRERLAEGPTKLYDEVLTAIRTSAGIQDEELKNSQPPSTSSDRADGKSSSTTASSASSTDSTEPATVVSILN